MVKLDIIFLEDDDQSQIWELNENCTARPRTDIIKRGRVKIPNLDVIERKRPKKVE